MNTRTGDYFGCYDVNKIDWINSILSEHDSWVKKSFKKNPSRWRTLRRNALVDGFLWLFISKVYLSIEVEITDVVFHTYNVKSVQKGYVYEGFYVEFSLLAVLHKIYIRNLRTVPRGAYRCPSTALKIFRMLPQSRERAPLGQRGSCFWVNKAVVISTSSHTQHSLSSHCTDVLWPNLSKN